MPADSQPSIASRATLVNAPGRYRPDIDRWAVIVGISEYQHRGLNLRWAHRDAEELYKLLLTPAGGSFAADHVQLLVNQAATTQAVSRALRSFLKKPAREDLVLIYFACHGGPDPDRPYNLYLLTHDTDPDDIAGTALPMREIDLSLKENLLAERVVVLADTCHSAGIGGGIGRRSVSAEAGVVNAYLDAMSAARGGWALLTSAEASETSQEDARWGDGHGVFTYYLLEGLRGAADGFSQPRDGKVGVGELFDYVRQQVQQATGNSQHPAIGSNFFDRNLPLAITGSSDAKAHLELGCCLMELARIAGEPDRYRAAAHQFEEALRLSSLGGAPLAEASWRLAQAWLAVGEGERALQVLARAYSQFQERPIVPYPQAHLSFGRAFMAHGAPEQAIAALATAVSQGEDDHQAVLALGTAQVAARQYSAARATFDRLQVEPSSPLAQPIRDLRSQGQDLTSPRRHALVVGIDRYADPAIAPLAGAVNDARAMRDALVQRLGFQPENVVLLLDEDASRKRVLTEFRSLAAKAETEGTLFYFAGYGSFEIEEIEREELALPTLALYDSRSQAQDLRLAELAAIAHKANHLVVIADAAHEASYYYDYGAGGLKSFNATIGREGIRELEARYAAAPGTPRGLGSPPVSSEERPVVGHVSMFAQGAGELPLPALLADGQETRTHGVMTWGLLRALEASDPTPLNYRAWLEAAGQQVAGLATWEPLLLGAADEPLFDPRSERAALLATAARIELNAVYRAIELLQRQIGERSQQGALHPDGWVSLGVAYGLLGDYQRALEALEKAAGANGAGQT